MAVEDKYVDTTNITGNVVLKLQRAIAAQGAQLVVLQTTFEVAAADSDGSVYRVFKNVDPNLVPLFCAIGNDAITAGTDYGLGLYKPNLGVVINKDAFAANMDMSAAAASLNPKTGKDGMAGVDIANCQKRIFEHAAHDITTRLSGYDIALTADTVGSAAGTISVLLVCAVQ